MGEDAHRRVQLFFLLLAVQRGVRNDHEGLGLSGRFIMHNKWR
jgi:hypothetical protein